VVREARRWCWSLSARGAPAVFRRELSAAAAKVAWDWGLEEHMAQRLLVVQPRAAHAQETRALGAEALRLVEALDGADGELLEVADPRRNRATKARSFFGTGTVSTIGDAVREQGFKTVVVNAGLTGLQQRNLERTWEVRVIDRVSLIIDVFANRAYTREARLQVELAALAHRASRLVRGGGSGFGDDGSEIVSGRLRTRGSASIGGLGGGGGAGETELQLQRRRLREKRKVVMAQVEAVRRTRALHRASRTRRDVPSICLVGYTNAGKTTLLSALGGTDVPEGEDALFATLDPTAREVGLPSGSRAVLADTVGFLRDLPPVLVKAFHATLEEAVHADVLVHVVDASAPDAEEQRSAVLRVLASLLNLDSPELAAQRCIEVWNKIDLAGESEIDSGDEEGEASSGEGFRVSALSGEGLPTLMSEIERRLIINRERIRRRASAAALAPKRSPKDEYLERLLSSN